MKSALSEKCIKMNFKIATLPSGGSLKNSVIDIGSHFPAESSNNTEVPGVPLDFITSSIFVLSPEVS